ncbi:MAG: sortase [Angelakisella sp.]
MEENELYQARRTRRHVPVARIAILMSAYLCVLGTAIWVDGVVEAQAQHRVLVEEAATIQVQNLSALETAREEALVQAQQRAATLAALQVEEQKVRNEEAAKALEATAGNKPTTNTPTTPAAPPKPAVSGVFEASAYGYTAQDKLSYWQSVNNDTIGYLYIPGTNISHAVVQNTSDVNYYTKRGYDKQSSYYGVLWTNPDTNSSGSSANMSSNTVIYGHNWTNYSSNPRIRSSNDIMFGQLTSYHHLAMAKSYPYFYYSTAQEAMTFKIFACFYAEPAFGYNQTEGNTQYIVEEALRRSRHDFNVDVSGSDKIITLSTCTRAYGATSNQRFVVMGRLLRPGESITPVDVVANPNHKQPNVWG